MVFEVVGVRVCTSECTRQDGERHDGIAGLQLQGSEEALGGSGHVALRLQHLGETVPARVRRGTQLHGFTQNLLC